MDGRRGRVIESRRVKFAVGDRFGRWTVIGEAPPTKWARMLYATCDCGTSAVVSFKHLRNGASVSCGCFKRENAKRVNTKHGGSGGWKGRAARAPEYNIWLAMKMRCSNPRVRNWHRYGGRGISVCERWSGDDGFANFLADVGPRPSTEHSIDRFPNNDGNYEPGNVRWATDLEQGRNKSNSVVDLDTARRIVEVVDSGLTIREASDRTGIPYAHVYSAYRGVTGRRPPNRDRVGRRRKAA